jgi:hypothetical protein
MPIAPINPIFLPVEVLAPIAPPVPPISTTISPPVSAATQPPPARPEVILIAGVNYPHHRGAITDTFTGYCKTIAPSLFKKYLNTKVTVFNFFESRIEEWTLVGNIIKPTIVKSFDKLNKDNYWYVDDVNSVLTTKPPFPDAHTRYFVGVSEILKSGSIRSGDYIKAISDGTIKEKSISIDDVYKYMIEIGQTTPQSIQEIHFFSHAYIGGPILVNTIKYKIIDKDGRQEDFSPTTGKISNLNDFRKSFDVNAFSAIWGCNAFRFPKKTIHHIIDDSRKDYEKAKKDPNEKLFEFQYDSDWGANEVKFHQLMHDADPPTTGNKSEKKSLNDVIAILKDILDKTYMQANAAASNKDVMGALPGTYADLDKDSQKNFGVKIMHIPMGRKFDDFDEEKGKNPKSYINFKGILKFYEDHLGVTFKPNGEYDKHFGRGYAIYKP